MRFEKEDDWNRNEGEDETSTADLVFKLYSV